ncbi:zinc metalloprotease HtpX [Candidatus Dependentiae bacterium]|nr:zinc metalloprotease HtpX [Candidatus Dependentiae bacterium]
MNKIKTVLLLGALSSLLLLLGQLFGGTAGLQFALIMALVMNGIAYFFSETIVLKMYRAQKLDAEKYSWLYDIVQKLALTMKIPMPKLWLINTPMANAFATGRNPSHASIAVTTGILEVLDTHELRGVLAHELSHVKNRDILVSTIAATVATAIGYLANMIQYAAFWGSMSNDRRQRGNPIFMLLVAMLMPIAAMLIQLAISRSREYLADETGSHYSHDPLALASALEKLHNNIPRAHMDNKDATRATTAPLFIVHPFTTNGWASLFSTHPPMRKRVERLQKLYEQMHGKRF